MIYKELNIFDDKFNWDEFNRRMLQFMVLNSIEIVNLYRLPKVSFTNLVKDDPELVLQTKEKFFAEVASLISRYILRLPTEFHKVYKAFYHDSTSYSDINTELNKCEYLQDEKTISTANFNNIAKAAGYEQFANMISKKSAGDNENTKYFHNLNTQISLFQSSTMEWE